MSSRAGRAAGALASTASGRLPERDDVDDAARFGSERPDLGGGGYRSTPENAACSVRPGRATTHSLGRCRLWPVLPVHVWPVLRCPPRRTIATSSSTDSVHRAVD